MFNLFCPINQTGYGMVGIDTLFGLIENGIRPNLCVIPSNQSVSNLNDKDTKLVNDLINTTNLDLNFKDKISFAIWFASDTFRFFGKKRIIHPFFELDRLKPEEKAGLSSCDLVLAPSHWAKQIINRDCPGLPCEVLNPGLNPVNYKYVQKDRSLKDELTLLNIGKFEARKGHYLLLGFLSYFNKFKLKLIANWFNPFIDQKSVMNIILAHNFEFKGLSSVNKNLLTPQISCLRFVHKITHNELLLINQYNNSPTHITTLASVSDLGIFPYSSEGWCLPLFECMASGLPCIATNYSAPMDFLTSDNHIPIEVKHMIPAKDEMFFTSGFGKWASVENSQLVNIFNNLDFNKINNINKTLSGFLDKWTRTKQVQKLITYVQSLMTD